MLRVKCHFDDKAEPAAKLISVRGRRAVRSVVRFTMDLSGSFGGSCGGILRRGSRVKHLRIVVDERGLTVVAPVSFRAEKELDALLDRHLEWILKSLDKFRVRALNGGEYPVDVPETIELPSVGETWRVVRVSDGGGTGGKRAAGRIRTDGMTLMIPDVLSRSEVIHALRSWVRARAAVLLPPMLLEAAEEMTEQSLPRKRAIGRISVKDMRTQWGSCSLKGNINLNSRLLFLPPDLVRHVMLHELCHLSELNHSKAFYDLLRAADIETDIHRAELRKAWRSVPAWVVKDA